MIFFLIFFAFILMIYPIVYRIKKGNLRAVFFSYLRMGAFLSVALLLSGGVTLLNIVLVSSILSFWIAAIYGVLHLQSKLAAKQ